MNGFTKGRITREKGGQAYKATYKTMAANCKTNKKKALWGLKEAKEKNCLELL